MENKKYLKEDGSLDIERINKLPIEEYIEVVGAFTQEQYKYYSSQLPNFINESYHGPAKAIVVDYTLEEELERGCLDLEVYLKNKRKEYEKRR